MNFSNYKRLLADSELPPKKEAINYKKKLRAFIKSFGVTVDVAVDGNITIISSLIKKTGVSVYKSVIDYIETELPVYEVASPGKGYSATKDFGKNIYTLASSYMTEDGSFEVSILINQFYGEACTTVTVIVTEN